MPGTSRVTTPLLSSSPLPPPPSTPRCPDTMKLNAASRIYLDVSVLPSEQSRADDDADEENDDSTRKKNGGNRICRNRYTGPPNATWPQEMRNPLPPSPSPSPVELAALSWNRWRLLALFFTGFTCAIPRTRNTILLYSGWRVGTIHVLDSFKAMIFLKRTSENCRELKFDWWIRGQRQEENGKILETLSRTRPLYEKFIKEM